MTIGGPRANALLPELQTLRATDKQLRTKAKGIGNAIKALGKLLSKFNDPQGTKFTADFSSNQSEVHRAVGLLNNYSAKGQADAAIILTQVHTDVLDLQDIMRAQLEAQKGGQAAQINQTQQRQLNDFLASARAGQDEYDTNQQQKETFESDFAH